MHRSAPGLPSLGCLVPLASVRTRGATAACAASLPRGCGSLAVPRRIRSHSPRSYRLRSSATPRATLRGNGDRARVARASYGKRHNKERMGRDDELRRGAYRQGRRRRRGDGRARCEGGRKGRRGAHWSKSRCGGFGSGNVGARQTGQTRESRNQERMQWSWKLCGGEGGRQSARARACRARSRRGGRTCAGTRAGRRRTGRP